MAVKINVTIKITQNNHNKKLPPIVACATGSDVYTYQDDLRSIGVMYDKSAPKELFGGRPGSYRYLLYGDMVDFIQRATGLGFDVRGALRDSKATLERYDEEYLKRVHHPDVEGWLPEWIRGLVWNRKIYGSEGFEHVYLGGEVRYLDYQEAGELEYALRQRKEVEEEEARKKAYYDSVLAENLQRMGLSNKPDLLFADYTDADELPF